MSPTNEEGPRQGALSNTLNLGAEHTPAPYRGADHQAALDAVPRCWVCGRAPVLYVGADGRNVHRACEPADVGLTDPPTSHKAARRARRGIRSPLAQAILAELRSRPEGSTDAELQQMFYESPAGSVSKRRCDLAREGLVVDSGRTRPTRWGREAIVWIVR